MHNVFNIKTLVCEKVRFTLESQEIKALASVVHHSIIGIPPHRAVLHLLIPRHRDDFAPYKILVPVRPLSLIPEFDNSYDFRRAVEDYCAREPIQTSRTFVNENYSFRADVVMLGFSLGRVHF